MAKTLWVLVKDIWYGRSLNGRALRTALLAYLLLRLSTMMVGMISALIPESAAPREIYVLEQLRGLQSAGELSRLFLAPWYRWDTMGYMRIAVQGYEVNVLNTVWPPLYPLLISCFGWLFSSPLFGALFVSNIACLASFFLLYRLTEENLGESIAARSVWVIATFPSAFYLVVGYSESLFLALMLATLWAGRKKRFLIAGFLGMLASLCRVQGVLLVLPLIWESYSTLRKQAPVKRLRQLMGNGIAIGLIPLGFFFFAWYIHDHVSGIWIWQMHAEVWGHRWALPWEGIIANFSVLVGWQEYASYSNMLSITYDLLAALAFPILLILAARKFPRLPVIYQMTGWIFLLLPMSITKEHEMGMYIALSRYVLSVVPAYIAMAWLVRKKRAWLAWLVFGLASQMILSYAFTRWIWVA